MNKRVWIVLIGLIILALVLIWKNRIEYSEDLLDMNSPKPSISTQVESTTIPVLGTCKAGPGECCMPSGINDDAYKEGEIYPALGPIANGLCRTKDGFCSKCKCLSSATNIDTQEGSVNVKDLKVRMLVWTINNKGEKELQPIIKLSVVDVGRTHTMSHLVLFDGREVMVSPNHPTADGRLVADLRIGESYNDSIIQSIELLPYTDTKTYDLLPTGDTGYYFANGILIGSTLK